MVFNSITHKPVDISGFCLSKKLDALNAYQFFSEESRRTP